jgi:peptide/nickel transport system ATP-binding protein/oligopeptide transport system ATP-binding protein
MSGLLEVSDLKVYFHTRAGIVRAVDGVNLTVKPRKTVGLVGESGSGKSTLARAIIGLLPPQGRIMGGSIRFMGEELVGAPEERLREIRGRKISMVFQDAMSFLNPVMKVGDQIAEAIPGHRKNKAAAYELALELLERVGVPRSRRLIDDYPHQLSGGLRQRVMLAIAVASNPALVIADEATSAVDVTVQAQILELLKELADKMGCAVLFITHDLGVVAETCDEVYVMYAGKIVEHADVKRIYESPMHPYTSALINSALSIQEYKEHLEEIGGEVPNLINPPSGCRFHPRCPIAKQICSEKEPPLLEPHPNHGLYCWHYVKEGEG